MEYDRSAEGQIHADFARRCGQLLLQYGCLSDQLPAEERFEATLAMALLQSMLAQWQERLQRSSGQRGVGHAGDELRALAQRSPFDQPASMGLQADCVVECWPSTRPLTYREVFESLRHALSHPCAQGKTRYAATGYTTLEMGSGRIEVFEFVYSPWVNSKGSGLSTRFAPTGEEGRVKLEQAATAWGSKHGVEGLVVEAEGRRGWRVVREGSPFIPVLRIRLGARPLRTLALTLSDLLASPLTDTEPLTA